MIGWSSAGPLHADGIETRRRKHTSSFVLQQVADTLGDVDGFVEQFDARARQAPAVAAEISQRLLAAGRTAAAWTAVERVDTRQREGAPMEWEQARLDVRDALGRADEAQAFRWARFTATLNATHLRAFLRKLPDLDDVEAEHRALAHAHAFGNVHQALSRAHPRGRADTGRSTSTGTAAGRMTFYLMDANVVIRAHADYYPLDRLPLFWAWLLSVAEAGRVAKPFEVFEEVCRSPDFLGQWLRRAAVRKAIVLTRQQTWPRFRL